MPHGHDEKLQMIFAAAGSMEATQKTEGAYTIGQAKILAR